MKIRYKFLSLFFIHLSAMVFYILYPESAYNGVAIILISASPFFVMCLVLLYHSDHFPGYFKVLLNPKKESYVLPDPDFEVEYVEQKKIIKWYGGKPLLIWVSFLGSLSICSIDLSINNPNTIVKYKILLFLWVYTFVYTILRSLWHRENLSNCIGLPGIDESES